MTLRLPEPISTFDVQQYISPDDGIEDDADADDDIEVIAESSVDAVQAGTAFDGKKALNSLGNDEAQGNNVANFIKDSSEHSSGGEGNGQVVVTGSGPAADRVPVTETRSSGKIAPSRLAKQEPTDRAGEREFGALVDVDDSSGDDASGDDATSKATAERSGGERRGRRRGRRRRGGRDRTGGGGEAGALPDNGSKE